MRISRGAYIRAERREEAGCGRGEMLIHKTSIRTRALPNRQTSASTAVFITFRKLLRAVSSSPSSLLNSTAQS